MTMTTVKYFPTGTVGSFPKYLINEAQQQGATTSRRLYPENDAMMKTGLSGAFAK